MKTENTVLMRMARASLNSNWGIAIGTFVVYMLIAAFTQFIPLVGSIAWLIISGPLVAGIAIFSLSISRNKEAKLEQIFEGFNNFGKNLSAYMLMILFILLWSLFLIIPAIFFGVFYSTSFFTIVDVFSTSFLLLLSPLIMVPLIPAIIVALSYSMTFFILADDADISAMDSLKKSKSMMNGYKWKYFRLLLRFFGLGLLCILTLGIGFLWLAPYMQVSMSKFYDDIKDVDSNEELISIEDLQNL